MSFSSTPLLLALAFVAGLAVAWVLWKIFFAERSSNGDLVYEIWKTILTPAEREFAKALDESLPPGVRLLAKVRLSDVFFVHKDLDAAKRSRARNRINQMDVDFLLVRASDFSPLLGVELDEPPRPKDVRPKRDRFVNQVFASCALPLVHVPAQASYDLAELREKIDAQLELLTAGENETPFAS